MFGHLCKACQVFAQCPAGEYGEEEEGQAGICKEKQELHLCVNTHVDKILDFIAQSLSYVFSWKNELLLKECSLDAYSVYVLFVLSRTALMMACETGSLNMVEAFLTKGADVSLVDVFGQNALHYSKLSENTGIQNLLVSKLSQDVGM